MILLFRFLGSIDTSEHFGDFGKGYSAKTHGFLRISDFYTIQSSYEDGYFKRWSVEYHNIYVHMIVFRWARTGTGHFLPNTWVGVRARKLLCYGPNHFIFYFLGFQRGWFIFKKNPDKKIVQKIFFQLLEVSGIWLFSEWNPNKSLYSSHAPKPTKNIKKSRFWAC